MLYRFIRNVLILIMVVSVVGAVTFFVLTGDEERIKQLYNEQSTSVVQTAIAAALFDATRTVEGRLPQYRVVVVEDGESLESVAERYGTSADAIRMVNGLPPEVQSGDGGTVIVPEGVTEMIPARKLILYEAIAGDTLEIIAFKFDIQVELLMIDNPVLAQRGIIPGDTVFVPEVL